jgi:hypothetical protein
MGIKIDGLLRKTDEAEIHWVYDCLHTTFVWWKCFINRPSRRNEYSKIVTSLKHNFSDKYFLILGTNKTVQNSCGATFCNWAVSTENHSVSNSYYVNVTASISPGGMHFLICVFWWSMLSSRYYDLLNIGIILHKLQSIPTDSLIISNVFIFSIFFCQCSKYSIIKCFLYMAQNE